MRQRQSGPDSAITEPRVSAGTRAGTCSYASTCTRSATRTVPAPFAARALGIRDFANESAVAAAGYRHGDAHDRRAERRYQHRPLNIQSRCRAPDIELCGGAFRIDDGDVHD